MITIRKSAERGQADFGWLRTSHSFSFGSYHDRDHMGFGPLRVINEDHVAPGSGFDMHGHKDMEIVTYVLSGALEHKDSLGSGSVIRHGDVQRMTAGRGIRHAEFNPSLDEPVHLLQIWILPERVGLEPSYEEKRFFADDGEAGVRLVAAPDGRDGALAIHRDAEIGAARLKAGETLDHAFAPGRIGWLQVARGRVDLDGTPLRAGDGAGISGQDRIAVRALEDTEFLLFDMAGQT
ncbi:pirin family protein [Kaustia mangrovi]|uniref:Pirin family protein n=1 Tax=Kaustia mangrovi TaxID=2593653 RepID=A0A7S8HCL9_9HYPH|nr:pirin family protein [Kaustia mangrovi]QPC43740.1 pirin family protein [Kaustia mangrovi]